MTDNLIIRNISNWRIESRIGRRHNKVYYMKQTDNKKKEILELRKQISKIKEDIKKSKPKKLQLTKEDYVLYIEKNKGYAKERRMNLMLENRGKTKIIQGVDENVFV
jgi:hypothetical protein